MTKIDLRKKYNANVQITMEEICLIEEFPSIKILDTKEAVMRSRSQITWLKST
jgi:hypothetical protein